MYDIIERPTVNGSRFQSQRAAAMAAGITLIGGHIVLDGASGKRFSRAFVIDPQGHCVTQYRKVHIPNEIGFREVAHYESGAALPDIFRLGEWPCLIQICSDVNRPAFANAAGASGVRVIFAPRATPDYTYSRWELVLRALAVTSGTYVVSVNRPRPERGATIGGAPLALVTLDASRALRAKTEYPASLAQSPHLYAAAWQRVRG